MRILLLVLVVLFAGNAVHAATVCPILYGSPFVLTNVDGMKSCLRCIQGNVGCSGGYCNGYGAIPYSDGDIQYNHKCTTTGWVMCSGCTDCDTVDWHTASPSIDVKTIAVCNCGTCNKTHQYRCKAGYYGTAENGIEGCTVCPANATCAGGNGSTFVCNTGYTKSGDQCVIATCGPGFRKQGTSCVQCDSGTYKVGTNTATSCTNCPPINLLPTGGTETISGGVASKLPRAQQSDCYLQGKFRNTAGEFQIDSTNCTYKNDSSSGFGL